MDIEKLDPKIKLKDSQTPLALSMNKKNVSIYFEGINSILIENNFHIIKTIQSKYWNNHLYSTVEVELSFNDLKKIVKKHFADVKFQDNTFQVDEENYTLLWCYELRCPFLK
tara:strand:+ start:889 stop:1224 length:336 start_codon:yes stop_codon:yes gene_type:complete